MSRILATSVLGAALLLVADPARAHDAAADAPQHAVDAAPDSAPHARDAAPADGAAHLCIGNGEPCQKSDTCCVASAYCGSFQSMSDNLVCGNDSNQALPTGCGVGGASGVDALAVFGVLGVGMAVRRRRRRNA